MSRSVASASAVAVLANASPALAAPLAGEPGLAELIEAHKAAFDRVEHAWRVVEELRAVDEKELRANPIRVPLVVLPDGRSFSGAVEYGTLSDVEVENWIREKHEELRHAHYSKWLRLVHPEFMAAIERDIDDSQQKALRVLGDVKVSMATRPERAAAQDAAEAADDEELRARVAFVLFVPRDEREAAMKAAYIEDAVPFNDQWSADEFVDAILDHLSLPPAGAGVSAAA